MTAQRYTGSGYVDVANVRRWGGSSWITAGFGMRWDGTDWIPFWITNLVLNDDEAVVGFTAGSTAFIFDLTQAPQEF